MIIPIKEIILESTFSRYREILKTKNNIVKNKPIMTGTSGIIGAGIGGAIGGGTGSIIDNIINNDNNEETTNIPLLGAGIGAGIGGLIGGASGNLISAQRNSKPIISKFQFDKQRRDLADQHMKDKNIMELKELLNEPNLSRYNKYYINEALKKASELDKQ